MKKILRGIFSAALTLSMICTTAFAQPDSSDVENAATESAAANEIVEKPAVLESKVNLPVGMRAVFAAPETDFSLDGTDADKLCGNIRALEMNAVVIRSTANDNDYYSLELGDTDALNSVIEAAHKSDLGAYITLDVNSLLRNVAEQGGGLKAGFSAAAHKFAIKYNCEGILLTNYYTNDTPEMYAEYLHSGSGIGYENWLYETNRFIMRSLSEIVRKTSNSTALGILAEDMWANSDANPDGSQTADNVQALYDGHCDTKKYVENKYVDFVMVKAYGSTSDSALNFENVVSWWNGLAEKNGIRTYVCHLNERIGDYSGWNEDQLLQQLTVMKKMSGSVSGSAFNSLYSLNANPLSSTDTLKKFFSDEINTNTLNDELKITSPPQLSQVTYDRSVTFEGTFDENFDVFLDGNKVEMKEPGSFRIQKDLKIGNNYFTLEHKGKKYEYSIERKVDVLRSVYDLGHITVDDGTTLSFSAVAYSGSNVYVTIGGETISLVEEGLSDHSNGEELYSEYVGYYTASGGLIGEERYLGDVSYYAVYNGYDESSGGGSVTIAAKPEPPKLSEPTEVPVEIPVKSQLRGIDISSYQGDIDFTQVKDGGYDFVIIKAGEWNHTIDGYETYYTDAKNAGLYVGFYWYCDGETLEEISLEADACIEALSDKQSDLPIYMDIENEEQFEKGMEFCSEAVRTFCGKLEAAGLYTGLYANTTWLDVVIADDIKEHYTLWVADWREYCGYNDNYGIWQYGFGYVPGINNMTDLNIIDIGKDNPILGYN